MHILKFSMQRDMPIMYKVTCPFKLTLLLTGNPLGLHLLPYEAIGYKVQHPVHVPHTILTKVVTGSNAVKHENISVFRSDVIATILFKIEGYSFPL